VGYKPRGGLTAKLNKLAMNAKQPQDWPASAKLSVQVCILRMRRRTIDIAKTIELTTGMTNTSIAGGVFELYGASRNIASPLDRSR
jgi:hypothetical protein